MAQPERTSEILKPDAYRHLKPTPDLSAPIKPLTPDELEEARLLFDYETELEKIRQQRGY